MNRSVLLRILPSSRTGRRLAGIAEVVDTGERRAFHDAEDLLSLLQRLHDDPLDHAEPAPIAPGGGSLRGEPG